MPTIRSILDAKFSGAVELQLNDSALTYLYRDPGNGAESLNLSGPNRRLFVLQRASLDQERGRPGVAIREYFNDAYSLQGKPLTHTKLCTTYFTLQDDIIGLYYPEFKAVRPLRREEQRLLMKAVSAATYVSR